MRRSVRQGVDADVTRYADAGRAELKEKQLAWLKQREEMEKSERTYFTRLRVAYLRARAEN